MGTLLMVLKGHTCNVRHETHVDRMIILPLRPASNNKSTIDFRVFHDVQTLSSDIVLWGKFKQRKSIF